MLLFPGDVTISRTGPNGRPNLSDGSSLDLQVCNSTGAKDFFTMGANLSYPTVDLSDRVVLVTGGNSGIGYATAKIIARMGAHTIIACRSRQKAAAAVEQMKQEIAAEYPDKQVKLEYMLVDLSSFRSVKELTVAFREKNLPLHVLINNAALSAPPHTITDDGYELQYEVNHLGPFLLTLELLPIILDSAHSSGDARILFVSSAGHFFGVFDPANMNGDHNYGRLQFYNNSKLYNVMTAYALQRRLQNMGVTVSTLHPGIVRTNLASNLDSKALSVLRAMAMLIATNIYNGAATSLLCAVSPDLKSQQCFYYDGCKVKQSSATSRIESSQEQLWEISINAVKDYLSPEVLQQYRSPPQHFQEQSTAETTGRDTHSQQPTNTSSSEETTKQLATSATSETVATNDESTGDQHIAGTS